VFTQIGFQFFLNKKILKREDLPQFSCFFLRQLNQNEKPDRVHVFFTPGIPLIQDFFKIPNPLP